MVDQFLLENILFLDIETVPAEPNFNMLNVRMKELWEKKSESLLRNHEGTAEEIYDRAGIYAEFGKIICISVGYFKTSETGKQFRIKSFADNNERKLLMEFTALLNSHYNKKEHSLCAHNGKEFDFPYLCRRLLINNIPLPTVLDISGKRPWETCLLDTMELWKFGDYKSYTSLNLLAAVFEIPTPKDDIHGSEVGNVFWKENNLARIVEYCQKDVLTVAQIFLRLKNQPLLEASNILIAEHVES